MKLFLPVFFLLGLSFVSVFGDTGSITIVSGKSFQINYDANYVQVLSAQANTQDQALIFSIQVTNPTSTLELTLPRELIDATKKDGSDDSFIVLADGAFTSYVEKSSDKTSRTILIQLAPENKELEIIGTSLASSGNGNTGTTQTPSSPTQTPIPSPTLQQPDQTSQKQNQTFIPAQKPTANAPAQNLSVQELLSKIFHFTLPNLPFNVADKQMIEYLVIAAAILILIIVIASSKKSKTRKQIRK
ncbi:MAG: hypothetical protein HY222_08410 [Thaumarchaeota archaeon]|nr:hypothetical protein [Nitrososphaerota archaeon]MBI3642397.1 hypothetical protein [Nitrososphaerota archaeon]